MYCERWRMGKQSARVSHDTGAHPGVSEMVFNTPTTRAWMDSKHKSRRSRCRLLAKRRSLAMLPTTPTPISGCTSTHHPRRLVLRIPPFSFPARLIPRVQITAPAESEPRQGVRHARSLLTALAQTSPRATQRVVLAAQSSPSSTAAISECCFAGADLFGAPGASSR